MLIQLTLKNYLSFKDETVFSMIASKDKEFLDNNTFNISKNINLLKNVLIYGPNASGKSNLIRAISFFRYFVLNSSKETQYKDPIPYNPFKLNKGTINKPSLLEFIFFTNDKRYRYGFEINNKRVVNEWLFATYKTKESKLFIREGNNFDIGNKFKEGKNMGDKTRENALF